MNGVDYRELAMQYARDAGISPGRFVAQIEAESGFDPNVVSSAGAVGIAQIMPASHPNVDPTDPVASLAYAARLMAAHLAAWGNYPMALAAYNAGQGNVRQYNWVPPFRETQQYVKRIAGPNWFYEVGRVFDPNAADELQQQDWTCSVRAATWLLKSIGVNTNAGEMQDLMVGAGLVWPTDGLQDGSGSALAGWLNSRWGLPAESFPDMSFRAAKARAGLGPMMIGGRRWNHWVGVRGVDPFMDSIRIMNPAPGWQGIQGDLDESDWSSLGPFAAVWVPMAPFADAGGDVSMKKFTISGTDGIGVNLRAGPGTDFAVVGSATEGQVLDGGAYAWRMVRMGEGLPEMWVADEFLKPVE